MVLVVLFVAALWAGVQNALAGGGSFVTLPALMLTGMDARAANINAVDQIERSSIDFYATTRSLYRQNRAAQINNGKAPDADLPNF